MPRVTRRARDVIIRVPKLLPYSKPSHAPNATAGSEATDPSGPAAAAQKAEPTVGSTSGTAETGASTVASGSSKDAGSGGASIAPGQPGAVGTKGTDGAAPSALPQTQHVNLRGETSAAEWNSLLIWARRQRGPQWDTGTAIWQVDKHSQEYYSYCSNPTQDILVQLDALHNPQHASTSGAADTLMLTNEGGAAGYDPAHAQQQQQQPGGLLASHQISGGGVNPMQMMMMGNTGQHGRDEREDSPPVIAPGRSTRLRNWA